VVEYSTDDGATWTDVAELGGDNPYSGELNGGPLEGRDAFTGVSSGYTSTRVDLSSLAGATVLLRFRISSDEIVGSRGWFIDDVDVYSCSPAAPSAPRSVVATAGNQEAGVSWLAPTSDGESAITGYTATATPGGHTCTTSSALGCTITGLTNATSHTITVHATNAVGGGPESPPSSPVTPTRDPSVIAGWSTTPLVAPASQTVWTPITVTSGGIPRTVAVQYRRLDSGTWLTSGTFTTSSLGQINVSYPVRRGVMLYRISAPPTARLQSATTATRKLSAKTTISGFALTSVSATRGTTVSDPITVTPGNSRWIQVQHRQGGTSRWVTFATQRTDTVGRVTIREKAFAGRHQWRVVAPESAAHGAAAGTAQRTITGR
jgi:Fibronectin type III domain